MLIKFAVFQFFRSVFQSRIQLSADAPPKGFRAKVDRSLGAPLKGRPFKGQAAVGVAQDRIVFFPYQPLMP